MKGTSSTRGRSGGGNAGGRRDARGVLVLVAKLAVAAGVLWFAIEGGEYGTSDLVRQRRAGARLQTEIDSLQRIVDSLGKYQARLERDPLLQERIAREEFGMVKGPHELLYRFADPAGADTVSPR